MKVYLAAAFSRQLEIRAIGEHLTREGIEVTSRWLYNNPIGEKTVRNKVNDAFMDVEDLRRADMVIRFSDDLSTPTIPSKLGSAARMFEFGMAWERGMPVVVVGGRQNVFDYLPNVTHVADVDELKVYLGVR